MVCLKKMTSRFLDKKKSNFTLYEMALSNMDFVFSVFLIKKD